MDMDRWPFLFRYNALKTEGMKWYPAWRDLSTYLNPTRGFFFNQVPNYGIKIDHSVLIDSHARRCIRDAASGMISGLTSPSRPWFKLGLSDPDLEAYAPVKWYLDESRNRMLEVASRSNIYDCFHSGYEEHLTFGTAAMLLLEDFNDVIRGRMFTAGEYFLGTGPDCRVNTFVRQYWMTVAQLVQEFGLDKVSPPTRAAFSVHQTERWGRVIHLIEPNDDRIPEYSDFKNMAYRSLQWEDGSMQNTYLRIGGFDEFPVIASRWSTTTTADAYGRSPGWDVLGDVKMLQQLQKNKLIALDKITNPPVQVDASVQGVVNMLPGGVTKFSNTMPNAGVKPAYQVQIDLNGIELCIEKTKAAISNAFYSDLFKMLIDVEHGNMTATEVAERQAEKLNMLSPIVEKLNNEQNNPFIARLYNIMNRNGLLPPPPPEIQGMELRVQYISTLAQAQKMVGVSAIEQTIAFVDSQMPIDPSVGDILNRDEANSEYANMTGVPAKMINAPDQVAKIRAEKAKQQAMMQRQQALLATAEAAKKGAGAVRDMANAPMGEGNALDKTVETIKQMTGQ